MSRRSFGSILKPKAGVRKCFSVAFVWKGKRHVLRAAATRADAAKMLERAGALLHSGMDVGLVLAEVFGKFHGSRMTFAGTAEEKGAKDLYLDYARGRKRPSTLAVDEARLTAIARDAAWATKPLGQVTTQDLMAWVTERQTPRAGERTVSVATINRDVSLVSALFRWAIRAGHVEENPARGVEKFSERGRAREVYLTTAECDVLLAACSDDVRPLVLAAIHTGARQGQLLALEWRDVDFARRIVRFRSEEDKTGTGRDVPMSRALEACLLALRDRKTVPLTGPDLVFLRAGKPWRGQTILDHLARAVAACGDDAPEGRQLPEAKRKALVFHDLRHTTASILVASGVPIFDVAKILGHKRIETTMRYAHFAPEAGRAAVDRLGDALAGGASSDAGAPKRAHRDEVRRAT